MKLGIIFQLFLHHHRPTPIYFFRQIWLQPDENKSPEYQSTHSFDLNFLLAAYYFRSKFSSNSSKAEKNQHAETHIIDNIALADVQSGRSVVGSRFNLASDERVNCNCCASSSDGGVSERDDWKKCSSRSLKKSAGLLREPFCLHN